MGQHSAEKLPFPVGKEQNKEKCSQVENMMSQA